jgi:TRAP-type mannitol/chloroaromatic compound transport system permease small subunit
MMMIRKLYDGMSLVSEWTGKAARWISVAIIVVICTEVFLRYVLNKPTIWSWALSYMLGSWLIALGLAYVYYHEGHVRIEVFYAKFSPKAKLVTDIFFTLIFFFPLIFMLTLVFFQDAWFAYSIGEVDGATIWLPLTWPYKTGIAIGLALLFLQGVVTFLRDITALAKGAKEPW